MERNFRTRPQGLIFLIFLIALLITTNNNGSNLFDYLVQDQLKDLIIPLSTFLFTFLASDVFGYIFTSIFYFVFNLCGGYSELYKKYLSYNQIKQNIEDLYQKEYNKDNNPLGDKTFFKNFSEFNNEVVTVYFSWYKRDHFEPLDDWITRRMSVYFINMSSVVAIIFSYVFGFLIKYHCKLQLTYITGIIFLFTVGIIIALLYNARKAKISALQAADLWLAGKVNLEFKNILDELIPEIDTQNKQVKMISSKSARKSKTQGKN